MAIASIWSVASWFDRVDNSPLIFFRIWFGLLLFLESVGAIATGWVTETLVEPTFTFSFFGFEWLQPLPGGGMYFYFAFMAVMGLGVMTGTFYRWSMAGFTLMWAAVYLMQKSNYNNHYYLLLLLSLMMLVMPANRSASFDVRWGKVKADFFCPRWCVGILLFQVGLVYFFAAMAKMEADWLELRPVDLWMTRKADFPLIGPILNTDFMKVMIAWGGMLFDLLIVPMLLWKQTRLWAFGLSLFFHLFNSAVFQIGIFPYLMIGFTLLFFPVHIRKWFFKKRPEPGPTQPGKINRLMVGLIVGWFIIQAALPLRHFFIPGEVNWTEEGHRLSWHMMTRSKWGQMRMTVKDPDTGETWRINPKEYLSEEQAKSINTRPDMIWAFAQYLKKHFKEQGHERIEVYVTQSLASLNGRPPQRFIDPTVDLAAIDWQIFGHRDWILPLKPDEPKN